MKHAVFLLLLTSTAHAASSINFGAGSSCTGTTYLSICGGFKSDNALYSLDSIARSNAGKITVLINNTQYTGQATFIEDQVIQQQIGPQDGIILEHVDSLQLNATNGTVIYLSMKVELQQHTGGGPKIKLHYTINTYVVQSGFVLVP